MNILTAVWLVSGICVFLAHPVVVHSSEKLLEASISTRAVYSDNVFLTTLPHDAVSNIVITPSLSGIIKEKNWQVELNSTLRINQYSDHNLDSNGQLLKLAGQYSAERNIFSISIGHDLKSSLNTTSTDFGLSRQKVERKKQSVAPQYTRFLTERLVLSLSYTYSDTDYDNDQDARFIASSTETGSAALRYNLTEKDQLSLSFQAVDYTRKDDLGDTQLFNVNIGFDHQFSEIVSMDLSVGVSRRNSTNLQTTTFDFLGRNVLTSDEINIKTSSSTFDLGIKRLLETGSIAARINRITTTNSFGGIDENDKFIINYDERFSSLWRYFIRTSYGKVTSVSLATTSTDREVLSLEAGAHYSLSRDWSMNLSYRYAQRKFNNISSATTPKSNRIQLGLTYNLPSLSTF